MFDEFKHLVCEVGQLVMHKGKKIMVAEVIDQGRKPRLAKDCRTKKVYTQYPGEKAYIQGCKLDFDGTPLKRSPVCVGTDWQHV